MFIGIDIGGTKVLAGEVDHDGRVLRTARRETPGRRVPAALVEAALTEAVDEVADGRPSDAVGLAAAGFVDSTRTRVLFAPHLPWHGEDVVARLSAAWGVPVIMDNDANCTALAETAYGAARDASSTVLVTLGTGIGGAVLLGGDLWRGAGGMAGEFGHQQLVPGGLPCQCGRSGLLGAVLQRQRPAAPRARRTGRLAGARTGVRRRPGRADRGDDHRGGEPG